MLGNDHTQLGYSFGFTGNDTGSTLQPIVQSALPRSGTLPGIGPFVRSVRISVVKQMLGTTFG